jgi:oxygen-independent coproporphyrinogen-3 oxidase
MVEPYINALIKEIRQCADMMNELGLKPRACYVGGGTPTAIEPSALARVIAAAQTAFPGAKEWTVEAGRPDSINREALKVLAAGNVGRISINPQTFNNETLARIGRSHTTGETLGAFSLARDKGFNNINMDLIAALPGEGIGQFARTMETSMGLSPEGVTVHTLALKRASGLRELASEPSSPELAAEMISLARAALTSAGYKPYYLYRQKYMAGNLENVGYAKPGFQCLYNIGHMEETARVLAIGAGGITKWLFPRERRIERAPNVRDIREYIDRVDEMAARKRRLIFN